MAAGAGNGGDGVSFHFGTDAPDVVPTVLRALQEVGGAVRGFDQAANTTSGAGFLQGYEERVAALKRGLNDLRREQSQALEAAPEGKPIRPTKDMPQLRAAANKLRADFLNGVEADVKGLLSVDARSGVTLGTTVRTQMEAIQKGFNEEVTETVKALQGIINRRALIPQNLKGTAQGPSQFLGSERGYNGVASKALKSYDTAVTNVLKDREKEFVQADRASRAERNRRATEAVRGETRGFRVRGAKFDADFLTDTVPDDQRGKGGLTPRRVAASRIPRTEAQNYGRDLVGRVAQQLGLTPARPTAPTSDASSFFKATNVAQVGLEASDRSLAGATRDATSATSSLIREVVGLGRALGAAADLTARLKSATPATATGGSGRGGTPPRPPLASAANPPGREPTGSLYPRTQAYLAQERRLREVNDRVNDPTDRSDTRNGIRVVSSAFQKYLYDYQTKEFRHRETNERVDPNGPQAKLFTDLKNARRNDETQESDRRRRSDAVLDRAQAKLDISDRQREGAKTLSAGIRSGQAFQVKGNLYQDNQSGTPQFARQQRDGGVEYIDRSTDQGRRLYSDALKQAGVARRSEAEKAERLAASAQREAQTAGARQARAERDNRERDEASARVSQADQLYARVQSNRAKQINPNLIRDLESNQYFRLSKGGTEARPTAPGFDTRRAFFAERDAERAATGKQVKADTAVLAGAQAAAKSWNTYVDQVRAAEVAAARVAKAEELLAGTISGAAVRVANSNLIREVATGSYFDLTRNGGAVERTSATGISDATRAEARAAGISQEAQQKRGVMEAAAQRIDAQRTATANREAQTAGSRQIRATRENSERDAAAARVVQADNLWAKAQTGRVKVINDSLVKDLDNEKYYRFSKQGTQARETLPGRDTAKAQRTELDSDRTEAKQTQRYRDALTSAATAAQRTQNAKDLVQGLRTGDAKQVGNSRLFQLNDPNGGLPRFARQTATGVDISDRNSEGPARLQYIRDLQQASAQRKKEEAAEAKLEASTAALAEERRLAAARGSGNARKIGRNYFDDSRGLGRPDVFAPARGGGFEQITRTSAPDKFQDAMRDYYKRVADDKAKTDREADRAAKRVFPFERDLQLGTPGISRLTNDTVKVGSQYRDRGSGEELAEGSKQLTNALIAEGKAAAKATAAQEELANYNRLRNAQLRGDARHISGNLYEDRSDPNNPQYARLSAGGARYVDQQNDPFGYARTREEAQSRKPRTIGEGFLRGVTSSGFNGGTQNLAGLAQAAGNTVKYSVLYDALNLVQQGLQQVIAEIANYDDSIANLELAYNGAGTASRDFLGDLSNIAQFAGVNLGDAMDQAAIGMRAFGDAAKDAFGVVDTGKLEALGTAFSQQVAVNSLITGNTYDQSSSDVRAAASAFQGNAGKPVSEGDFTAINDAIAGAKEFGGDANDISKGVSALATSGEAAGLTINQIAAIVSQGTARLGESGELFASRFSRVLSIFGGTAGQAALAKINAKITNDAYKVDLNADVSTQAQQLGSAIKNQGASGLSDKDIQQLGSALGGTANTREFFTFIQGSAETLGTSLNYAGKSAEEFARRSENLVGLYRRLQGSLSQVITSVTTSGVLLPLIAAFGGTVKVIETFANGLNAISTQAQKFSDYIVEVFVDPLANVLGPIGTILEPLKNLNVNLLGLAAAAAAAVFGLKGITAVRNAGGIRNLITGQALTAERVLNPAGALARQQLNAQAGGRGVLGVGLLGPGYGGRVTTPNPSAPTIRPVTGPASFGGQTGSGSRLFVPGLAGAGQLSSLTNAAALAGASAALGSSTIRNIAERSYQNRSFSAGANAGGPQLTPAEQARKRIDNATAAQKKAQADLDRTTERRRTLGLTPQPPARLEAADKAMRDAQAAKAEADKRLARATESARTPAARALDDAKGKQAQAEKDIREARQRYANNSANPFATRERLQARYDTQAAETRKRAADRDVARLQAKVNQENTPAPKPATSREQVRQTAQQARFTAQEARRAADEQAARLRAAQARLGAADRRPNLAGFAGARPDTTAEQAAVAAERAKAQAAERNAKAAEREQTRTRQAFNNYGRNGTRSALFGTAGQGLDRATAGTSNFFNYVRGLQREQQALQRSTGAAAKGLAGVRGPVGALGRQLNVLGAVAKATGVAFAQSGAVAKAGSFFGQAKTIGAEARQGLNTAGGALAAITIGAGLIMAAKDASDKLGKASDDVDNLLGQSAIGDTSEETQASADALLQASVALKEASSGFAGTIAAFFQKVGAKLFDNKDFISAKDKAEDTARLGEAAQRYAKQQADYEADPTGGTALSGNAEVDFSSADGLTASIKALQDSGLNATTIMDQLHNSLSSMSDAAEAGANTLTAAQKKLIAESGRVSILNHPELFRAIKTTPVVTDGVDLKTGVVTTNGVATPSDIGLASSRAGGGPAVARAASAVAAAQKKADADLLQQGLLGIAGQKVSKSAYNSFDGKVAGIQTDDIASGGEALSAFGKRAGASIGNNFSSSFFNAVTLGGKGRGFETELGRINNALLGLVQSGAATQAATAFEKLRDAAVKSGVDGGKFDSYFKDYKAAAASAAAGNVVQGATGFGVVAPGQAANAGPGGARSLLAKVASGNNVNGVPTTTTDLGVRKLSESERKQFQDTAQQALQDAQDQGADLTTSVGKKQTQNLLAARLQGLLTSLGLDPSQADGLAQTVLNEAAAQTHNFTDLDFSQLGAIAQAYSDIGTQAAARVGLLTAVNAGKDGKPGSNYVAPRFGNGGITIQSGSDSAQAEANVKEQQKVYDDIQRRGNAQIADATDAATADLMRTQLKSALEQQTDRITEAKQAVIATTIKNLQLISELAAASLLDQDQTGQLDAQIKGLQDVYNAQTNADDKNATYLQLLQLAKQRSNSAIADQQSQSLANINPENDIDFADEQVRQAQANLDRINNGYTVDVQGNQVAISGAAQSAAQGQAREALRDAEKNADARRVAADLARRKAALAPEDTLGADAIDVDAARGELNRLAAISTKSEAYFNALGAFNAAVKKQADDVASRDYARTVAGIDPRAAYALAQAKLTEDSRVLKTLQFDSQAYWEKYGEVVNDMIAAADALRNTKYEAALRSIDITNDVASAKADADAARAAYDDAVAQGAPAEVTDPLLNDARRKQFSSENAAFQQQLNDAQTADQLGRVSHAAYIQYLNNQHDRLVQQIAGMDDTTDGYRQAVDQLNQIDGLLKSAKESVNQAFNLQNVTLPTLYEVRRAVGASAEQIRSQVVDYSSTQGTVIINGADMATVVSYINKTLGTGSTSVYTTSPRRV